MMNLLKPQKILWVTQPNESVVISSTFLGGVANFEVLFPSVSALHTLCCIYAGFSIYIFILVIFVIFSVNALQSLANL